MHIETININVHSGQPSMARAFIEAMLRSIEPGESPGTAGATPAPAQESAASSAPKIGEYWTGMGGIYAGIARGRDGDPDCHLILATEAPKKDLAWQAALDLAKTITADGHSDFSVPTRWESALLYANLQDQFETDCWHWTSTQDSGHDAWDQDFGSGDQGCSLKSSERRCRFVRLIQLSS